MSPPARSAVSTATMRLRLCLWCTAAVVTEIGLYAAYRGHDARFHWFTHFFVGTSLSLLVMTAVTWRRRRPVPYPLIWLLVGHVFAMVPDLVFAAGTAHQRWMDLFAGHISTHVVPGGNVTWYVVFLVALAGYVFVIDRLRLRREG